MRRSAFTAEQSREQLREGKRKWKASLCEAQLARVQLRERETNRRWRDKNPERYRESRRVSRRKNAEKRIGEPIGNYTLAEWQALVAAWNHRCAYCGQEATKLHADHGLPVARGGSKHTMTEEEFRDLLAREERGLSEPSLGYDRPIAPLLPAAA